MAHKTELDAVDRKILRLLATDGRSVTRPSPMKLDCRDPR